MSPISTLSRLCIVGLAALAVATPAATARPADESGPPGRTSYQPAAPPAQDYVSPDARDGERPPGDVAGQPTWPAQPQPLHAPQQPADDGADYGWLIPILAVAGGGLALAGVARAVRRRVRAPRVSAAS